jgi:hypothetical protein
MNAETVYGPEIRPLVAAEPERVDPLAERTVSEIARAELDARTWGFVGGPAKHVESGPCPHPDHQPAEQGTAFVSIGRNVQGAPMSAEQWKRFRLDTLDAVAASIAPADVYTHGTGIGADTASEGVEDSFTLVFPEPAEPGWLQDRLAELAAAYRQKSIAYTVGRTAFIGPAARWVPCSMCGAGDGESHHEDCPSLIRLGWSDCGPARADHDLTGEPDSAGYVKCRRCPSRYKRADGPESEE